MRRRTFARLCTLCLATLAAAVAGQAQTRDVARTPWGHPDLEGMWTNATLTTLQRAAGARDEGLLHARRGGGLGEAARARRPTPTVRCAPVKSARTTTRSSNGARAA